MKTIPILLLLCLSTLSFCTTKSEETQEPVPPGQDTPVSGTTPKPEMSPTLIETVIEKELLYDQHTLTDTYPYKDTTREFQWDKIRAGLRLLDSIRQKPSRWAIFQNYRNKNGEAPLVRNFHRDAYKRISDTLGVERYQSVPLYLPEDTLTAERYGRDGALVKLLDDSNRFFRIQTIYTNGEWLVPGKYIKPVDSVTFDKAIFVDVTNQNIATLEHVDSKWLVRSMNPATTGQHRPPYAQETPLGIFVVQEKKTRMIYLVDGSKETGGFAPYASRFTNGGYIHGVPVNTPRKSLIEYSSTLGTTPRSHMCVRNATSHAKFIYDWASVNETIVFVFD